MATRGLSEYRWLRAEAGPRERAGEMARTAIVLFNLGGPDGPRAVRPFLFNLFNDPAIIGAPGPLRWLLARGFRDTERR